MILRAHGARFICGQHRSHTSIQLPEPERAGTARDLLETQLHEGGCVCAPTASRRALCYGHEVIGVDDMQVERPLLQRMAIDQHSRTAFRQSDFDAAEVKVQSHPQGLDICLRGWLVGGVDLM